MESNIIALGFKGASTAEDMLSLFADMQEKGLITIDDAVVATRRSSGLVKTKKPEETEKSIVEKVPKKYLPKLNRTFVAFGQTLCTPRNPSCNECPLNKICKRAGVKTPCSECEN